jgi:hypothetical protein
MLIIRVLLWGTFGYIGGWIAARKGYPPRLGIILGAITGPIGLLIGLLLPRTKEGRMQADFERRLATEAAARQACPSCGEEISAHANVCGICEHRIV